MLQNWFRETGGFRYSLKTQAVGSGNPALLHFLFKGPGGRVGYCEQFATAYAVMARTLQIPARVAVGFLQPHQGRKPGEWVYKAHDLHAWPELYFQGSGWVRFEPTPGNRAATTPSYTHEAGAQDHRPEVRPDPGRQAQHRFREPDHPAAAQPDVVEVHVLRDRHPLDLGPARARRAGRPRRRWRWSRGPYDAHAGPGDWRAGPRTPGPSSATAPSTSG